TGADEKALPYYQEACDILEKATKARQSAYARALNNLGWTHHRLEQVDKAEQTFARALEVWKKSHDDRLGAASFPGEEDTLAGLAAVHESRQDYHRAEDLLKQSLAICDRLYGTSHRQYTHGLYALARHYRLTKRLPEALKQLSRVLENDQASLRRVL